MSYLHLFDISQQKAYHSMTIGEGCFYLKDKIIGENNMFIFKSKSQFQDGLFSGPEITVELVIVHLLFTKDMFMHLLLFFN